jgi:hypothetical protein
MRDLGIGVVARRRCDLVPALVRPELASGSLPGEWWLFETTPYPN